MNPTEGGMERPLRGVYFIEMKPTRKPRAQELDQLLSGNAASGNSELEDLRRLVHQIRAQSAPEIDSGLQAEHLKALMRVVNLTDKGDLAVRPASKVNGPARQASGLPKQRRRLVFESVFATLAAKLVLGGAAVAMAATGGLAATGNLPDGAQTAVAQTVEGIGINIPLGETAQNALDEARQMAEQAAQAEKEAAAAAAAAEAAEQGPASPATPNENSDFGQGVAAGAQTGDAGRSIGEAAREQADHRRTQGQENRPVQPGPPGNLQPPIPAPAPPAGGNIPAETGPPTGPGSQQQGGVWEAGTAPTDNALPTAIPGGKPAGVGGGRP